MNNKKKIAVYVDGFNLYHGIKNLNKPYLKWLNLRSLAEKFIDPKMVISFVHSIHKKDARYV
jgi:hypothetical protein